MPLSSPHPVVRVCCAVLDEQKDAMKKVDVAEAQRAIRAEWMMDMDDSCLVRLITFVSSCSTELYQLGKVALLKESNWDKWLKAVQKFKFSKREEVFSLWDSQLQYTTSQITRTILS